jgi:hypothetical protein
MAHVHESAESPRAWERLFLPLRAKIPLQAAAVVIIAVMSVYVYQREDPQNPPSPTIAPVTPSAAPADTAAGSAAAVQSDTGSEIPQKPVRRSRVAPRQLHSSPRINAPRAEPDPLPQPAKQEIRRTIPIPAQGVIAAMGPSGPSRGFRADREFSNLGEPVPDYELFVRRRSNQERDQEADTPTKRADGENSSKPIEPNRRTETQSASASIVDVLWYTIPQDRYDDFKKELSTQATIESENAVGAKEKHSSFRADGPFYVKVIVLAPSER